MVFLHTFVLISTQMAHNESRHHSIVSILWPDNGNVRISGINQRRNEYIIDSHVVVFPLPARFSCEREWMQKSSVVEGNELETFRRTPGDSQKRNWLEKKYYENIMSRNICCPSESKLEVIDRDCRNLSFGAQRTSRLCPREEINKQIMYSYHRELYKND